MNRKVLIVIGLINALCLVIVPTVYIEGTCV